MFIQDFRKKFHQELLIRYHEFIEYDRLIIRVLYWGKHIKYMI